VLQDKPYEVLAFDGAVERFAGTALDVFEGDISILVAPESIDRGCSQNVC